jgi:hypothetical protein
VLDSETDGQHLRLVMGGFVRGLGVSCAHCHVGEEGQPLSTCDSPSDAYPNKDRARDAREMPRMLASISGHLAKLDPTHENALEKLRELRTAIEPAKP